MWHYDEKSTLYQINNETDQAVAAGAIPELKDYAPKSKNNVRI